LTDGEAGVVSFTSPVVASDNIQIPRSSVPKIVAPLSKGKRMVPQPQMTGASCCGNVPLPIDIGSIKNIFQPLLKLSVPKFIMLLSPNSSLGNLPLAEP